MQQIARKFVSQSSHAKFVIDQVRTLHNQVDHLVEYTTVGRSAHQPEKSNEQVGDK